MDYREFTTRINESPRPVVVDLWAPWCAPCRAMGPAFNTVSQKYAGQVDVLKINTDESPEVLKGLRVMGIPTVIGFANGKEVLRRTGVQSIEGLDVLFDAALHQRKNAILPPAPIDRLLRSGAGIALLALGWFNGPAWLLMGIGVVVLFSAFYDRCPLYRMIVPRLSTLLHRSR